MKIEFEVTEERLGCYRPEEHIDNPKDYADNKDAREYDKRLRPPVRPIELEIDPGTGMKVSDDDAEYWITSDTFRRQNYIATDGDWATSTGYIKFSFTRSIHYGRTYTNGASGTRGKEADLCEALRCLGQGLHCMEVLRFSQVTILQHAYLFPRTLVLIQIIASLRSANLVCEMSSRTLAKPQRSASMAIVSSHSVCIRHLTARSMLTTTSYRDIWGC